MHKSIGNLTLAETVTGKSGKTYHLRHLHKQKEGAFIYNLLHADTSVVKTLEIGCAQGLFSFHICSATHGREGAVHTMIDPFQYSIWDGVGVQTLLDAGFVSFDFIEKTSELALPLLLLRDEAQFDCILINGWHTFDHTLVDCFYATKLLKVGGYLLLDTASLPSIKRTAALLNTWPCYEEYASLQDPVLNQRFRRSLHNLLRLLSAHSSESPLAAVLHRKIEGNRRTQIIAFKKAGEDRRPSDWHNDGF